ncbi:MAG: hypothetical protein ACPGRX_01220 [Bdellovibrionales bacterium]
MKPIDAQTALDHDSNIELTRMSGFIDGNEDMFDLLARQSRRYKNDQALKHAVDKTMTMLKHAREQRDKKAKGA